jgi:hypothetical protein
MKVNLRALGLALIAVFAFGAVMASAVSAEVTDHFTSEVEKTVLTGEQVGTSEDNFYGIKKVSSLALTCKKVTFAGTVTGKSVTEITLVPTYFECTSNLGAATVTNDRCAFILTGTTDKFINTSGVEEGKDATVHLECDHNEVGGKLGSIRIQTGGCEFTLASTQPKGTTVNQNLKGVKYTNEGSGTTRDIKVDVTVDNIHYTTNDAFACTLAGIPTTGTDTFLTGTVTIKGYEDNLGSPTPWQDKFELDTEQVGISVS